MPKQAKEMSALEVKRLAHPGKGGNATFAVGGVSGLLLQITPTGGKTWLLRTKVGDRRREIGLGDYPDVPLASARDRAREAKYEIESGLIVPLPIDLIGSMRSIGLTFRADWRPTPTQQLCVRLVRQAAESAQGE